MYESHNKIMLFLTAKLRRHSLLSRVSLSHIILSYLSPCFRRINYCRFAEEPAEAVLETTRDRKPAATDDDSPVICHTAFAVGLTSFGIT
jgi:hypothetical protein